MNLKVAYRVQRNNAKARGVEWCFDFASWVAVWESSGRLHQRGCRRGNYVMARLGDIGPYSTENVEIVLAEKNAADCRYNHPRSAAELAEIGRRRAGTGRGWTLRGGRYQVTFRRRYIGLYGTQVEAEMAYQNAKRLERIQPQLMAPSLRKVG